MIQHKGNTTRQSLNLPFIALNYTGVHVYLQFNALHFSTMCCLSHVAVLLT